MEKKKKVLLLGAHTSIAGGLEKSVERAESIGCTCMQIFTKSNRQWEANPLKKEAIDEFKRTVKNSPSIRVVVAHASYLINIGSSDKQIRKKSIDALELELQRCKLLSIPYLVLHPGSYGTSTEEKCIDRIAEGLNKVFNRPGTTKILLENMSGQGTSVGRTFEQLDAIYKKTDTPGRIGFCFDTCHAFASGYTFGDKESYEALWQKFDTTLGLQNLKAFHINDSKKELGTKVDRHETIGAGKIGLEAFRLIFNDQRFFEVPKILETPKDDFQDDLKNLNTIKKLLSPETMKKIGK